jgi:hypothetical protein
MQTGNQIPNEVQTLYNDAHRKVEILDKVRSVWCNHINYDSLVSDRLPLTIVNMMVLRALSLLKLFEGVKVPSCKEDILVIDVESAFTLLRGIYEQTIVFHNLFVYPETEEEKKILLNLWKIKGLLNRQNLNNMPQEYKEKVKREADEISVLKREIQELPEHVISPSGYNAIENYLKKFKDTLFSGYIFKKDGAVINGGEPVSFTRAPKEFLHCEELNIVLYRLLSLHSHPSYISVLQFQEVRPTNDYWDYAILLLRGLCLMMDIFISDFCLYENLKVDVVSDEIRVYK